MRAILRRFILWVLLGPDDHVCRSYATVRLEQLTRQHDAGLITEDEFVNLLIEAAYC